MGRGELEEAARRAEGWGSEKPRCCLGSHSQVAIVKEMTGRNRAAQLEIVKQMSRQESRSSAGPDHVTEHALFTWLIIH